MNFDPLGHNETRPQNSIADLELRSVICVPLVRIRDRAGRSHRARSPPASETAGVLYMDSRISAADLAGGNRELLQTLAIEASTVLENARLLEEERAKQQMEEELTLARTIQQSLLPRAAAVGGLAARLRQQCGVARGGRRLFRRHRGECAMLVGRGGGRFRQGRQFRAAGVAVAGSADHIHRTPQRHGCSHRAPESISAGADRRRKSTPRSSIACWTAAANSVTSMRPTVRRLLCAPMEPRLSLRPPGCRSV